MTYPPVDLVRFDRYERKDDRTKEYLREFAGAEGVLYIGKPSTRSTAKCSGCGRGTSSPPDMQPNC